MNTLRAMQALCLLTQIRLERPDLWREIVEFVHSLRQGSDSRESRGADGWASRASQLRH